MPEVTFEENRFRPFRFLFLLLFLLIRIALSIVIVPAVLILGWIAVCAAVATLQPGNSAGFFENCADFFKLFF